MAFLSGENSVYIITNNCDLTINFILMKNLTVYNIMVENVYVVQVSVRDIAPVVQRVDNTVTRLTSVDLCQGQCNEACRPICF